MKEAAIGFGGVILGVVSTIIRDCLARKKERENTISYIFVYLVNTYRYICDAFGEIFYNHIKINIFEKAVVPKCKLRKRENLLLPEYLDSVDFKIFGKKDVLCFIELQCLIGDYNRFLREINKSIDECDSVFKVPRGASDSNSSLSDEDRENEISSYEGATRHLFGEVFKIAKNFLDISDKIEKFFRDNDKNIKDDSDLFKELDRYRKLYSETLESVRGKLKGLIEKFEKFKEDLEMSGRIKDYRPDKQTRFNITKERLVYMKKQLESDCIWEIESSCRYLKETLRELSRKA